MKKCPNCKMTVDADLECPFCYTTLTYEPQCKEATEKYVFNKFFVWYMIKQCWFSVLCAITVAINLIAAKTPFNMLYVVIIILTLVSVLYAIFWRKISQLVQWKYSKDFSYFHTEGVSVTTGLVAVILSFVVR